MSDGNRIVATNTIGPGTYADLRIPRALPCLADFINQKFDRSLIEAARNAVSLLRDHAEQLGQFSVDTSFDYSDRVRTRAVVKTYWGESGEALSQAYQIRQTVNHYIGKMSVSDYERDRLWIR